MDQKEWYNSVLEQYLQTLDSTRHDFSIPQEKCDKIEVCLRLAPGERYLYGAKFKVRSNKHFTMEESGARTVLYCKKLSKPIVTKERLFDVVLQCHVNVGHSGRDKTWAQIKSHYAGIKWSVAIFLKTCSSCTIRQPTRNPPAGRPIINLEFLQRLKIDLIDFRSRPDGEFCWILHARDQCTKFSWTYALKSKTAAEVA